MDSRSHGGAALTFDLLILDYTYLLVFVSQDFLKKFIWEYGKHSSLSKALYCLIRFGISQKTRFRVLLKLLSPRRQQSIRQKLPNASCCSSLKQWGRVNENNWKLNFESILHICHLKAMISTSQKQRRLVTIPRPDSFLC